MGTSPTDIRRAAMDLLARREHAQGELAVKLRRRFGADMDAIETEIDKLRDEGLQSDARLAEAFVRARAGRGQGPVKIKAELRGRGIADDIIAIALDDCGVDWFELVHRVSDKRFGSEAPTDAKEKAKRSRFLQQRGFSWDHISSLF